MPIACQLKSWLPSPLQLAAFAFSFYTYLNTAVFRNQFYSHPSRGELLGGNRRLSAEGHLEQPPSDHRPFSLCREVVPSSKTHKSAHCPPCSLCSHPGLVTSELQAGTRELEEDQEGETFGWSVAVKGASSWRSHSLPVGAPLL